MTDVRQERRRCVAVLAPATAEELGLHLFICSDTDYCATRQVAREAAE